MSCLQPNADGRCPGSVLDFASGFASGFAACDDRGRELGKRRSGGVLIWDVGASQVAGLNLDASFIALPCLSGDGGVVLFPRKTIGSGRRVCLRR